MPESTAQAFWIIVTDPGRVPESKGPIQDVAQLAMLLRQLMNTNPRSHLIVARISDDQLLVDDGTQALEMIDGRSAPEARRHRERLRLEPPVSPPKSRTRGPAPSDSLLD